MSITILATVHVYRGYCSVYMMASLQDHIYPTGY